MEIENMETRTGAQEIEDLFTKSDNLLKLMIFAIVVLLVGLLGLVIDYRLCLLLLGDIVIFLLMKKIAKTVYDQKNTISLFWPRLTLTILVVNTLASLAIGLENTWAIINIPLQYFIFLLAVIKYAEIFKRRS